jgi:small subunit ribosomal protein S1
MLSKRTVPNIGEKTPEIDEGWWASVLADEEAYASPQRPSNSKAPPSSLVSVDWDRVQVFFENDEIVVLNVYGFNRGGVLVQGDGIQGFVPVSHLVDMPCNAGEDERRQILNDYVGRAIDLKVIECEPAQERIVLSERAALAGQGRRRQLFNTLKSCTVL